MGLVVGGTCRCGAVCGGTGDFHMLTWASGWVPALAGLPLPVDRVWPVTLPVCPRGGTDPREVVGGSVPGWVLPGRGGTARAWWSTTGIGCWCRVPGAGCRVPGDWWDGHGPREHTAFERVYECCCLVVVPGVLLTGRRWPGRVVLVGG